MKALLLSLVLIGCTHTTPPVEKPARAPKANAAQCDQVYSRILAIKAVSMGYNDRELMVRLDAEYRSNGTTLRFYNHCATLNTRQVSCMNVSYSLPGMQVCEDMFGDQ